jgi:AcrR family transcriptional regulator
LSANTRQRILETTTELFRRQGFNGTGLKQIVAEANAPFGSLYHHFPGGKEQLAAEVVRSSGAIYEALVTGVIDAADDIVQGIRDAFDGAAAVLRETDYIDVCPIETVALEVSSTNETLRIACAEAFESWIGAGTKRVTGAGVAPGRARELATFVISTLEGAFVLARALRDATVVESSGRIAAAVVAEALAKSRKRRTPAVRRSSRPHGRR